MPTFIKYPVKWEHLNQCKVTKFCIVDRIDGNNFYTEHHVNEKGIMVYPKYNAIGFYCKNIASKDIFKFKGGFNIERCTKIERTVMANQWYRTINYRLPRKLKKKLLGTVKFAKFASWVDADWYEFDKGRYRNLLNIIRTKQELIKLYKATVYEHRKNQY